MDQALNSPTSIKCKFNIENSSTFLLKNNTWIFTPLQLNCNLVGHKWVFKIKYDHKNEILKRKPHLLAKGYFQQERVIDDNIFSLS